MNFTVLLVGGVKGYERHYNHHIQILHNLNENVTVSNTTFVSLQIGCPSYEEADLFIGRKHDNYLIVNDEIMEKFNFDVKTQCIPHYEEEIINYNTMLNKSFDFIIGEHCWFCNSVELLKYHNLLKLNGFLIRYASQFFPDGNPAFVEPAMGYCDKFEDGNATNCKEFLQNTSAIFRRKYKNVFEKTNDIIYDIEDHNLKYENHCQKYLTTLPFSEKLLKN